MSRLYEYLDKLWKAILRSVKDFPVEALLGLTYFALFICSKTIWKTLDDYLFVWFFPHYVLVFTLHRFSKRKPFLLILYILSWFLWIPLMLWGGKNPGWNIAIAYLLAVILLIIGEEPLDNERYGAHILDRAGRIVPGFLIGFLIMGIITVIIASLNFLFALNLKDGWFTYPNAFIAFAVIPLLCCSFVTRGGVRDKREKALRIVVDYILSPALIIYAAILYLYIIRIILRGELPNGGVAYMVASFMTVALICHLLRLQVEKRHFEWFYKAFPVIAIAPIILLWIGIFRRVGEYGMTEPRFYLIILAALITLFTAFLVKDKTRNFQLMTLILAATAFLFTFIPGIRAKDFGIRSQKARLEKALPLVLQDGKFPETLDYKAIGADPNLKEAWLTVDGAYSYLKVNMPKNEFKEIRQNLGECPFRQWMLNDPPKELFDPIRSFELGSPVDIGEYNQFIPSSDYHYYEDSTVAIFYKDKSREEELLRCEIREALDSPDNDPPDKLVYKNEEYMAVFEKIEDFHRQSLSFSTVHHILLKRSK